MIIDKIADLAEKSDYFKELFDKLEKYNFYRFMQSDKREVHLFSNKELNDLLRYADIFASTKNSKYRNYANRIVSNLYTDYSQNDIYNSYAYIIFTKLGLFPSIDILTNQGNKIIETSVDARLMEGYKKAIQHDKELDITYTDRQYEVVRKLKKKNNFSLSAPTSFGKTTIISNFINEVIKNKLNCNICILVPTNALLKEVSMDMKSKYEIAKYESMIKVLTYPEIKRKDLQYNNLIFVFTPERLVEYFANNTADIEYLFVDEAQKILKENDERSPIFYNAISYAAYRGTKLFFLSPNIENPEVFLSLANRDESNKYRVEDKLVIQNRYLFNFSDRSVKYLDYNDGILEDILLDDNIGTLAQAIKNTYIKYLFDTSTIVYFSSKTKMTEVLLDYIKDEPDCEDEEILNLIKVVKESVHEKYYLVKALQKGVAYHYGQMPKVIREKIEELFKNKNIKVLFTTSTLLEGVNIQAKNIILTSDTNGLSDLTEVDFLNLIGRAGRFRSELFGNVICLKGNFEKSVKYKYFGSQNVSNMKSEILDSLRGNFYKDIKQIIQKKKPITKNLEEEHKKYLIRQQYANIAILHNKIGYDSKLKANLINVNSDPSIFKSVDKNNKSVDKLSKFKDYTSIPIEYQQDIYDTIDEEIKKRYQMFDIKYLEIQEIKYLTEIIMRKYEFHKRGMVTYAGSYKYYSNLLVQWISGRPISVIIQDTIDKIASGKIMFLLDIYYKDKHKEYRQYVGSDYQINLIINDVLEKIEQDVKFMFKTYFSNYIYLNIENGSMDKSMMKIVEFIEFGTMRNDIIELQKYGFSRDLSLYLLKNHSDCIRFSESELDSINFQMLFENFDNNNILFEELKEYKYLLLNP